MNKKAAPWFRVFALCTAVGIGGTYVWRQQQKAAPPMEKPVERTVLSGSKSKGIAPTPSLIDQKEADIVLMPGSKSTVISPLPLSVNDRVLMEGSKSGRVVLRDSKSFIVIPEHEQTKERTVMPGSKSIVMPEFAPRKVVPAAPSEPATKDP